MSAIPTQLETPETVAAVDLGSNSFHMIAARLDSGQLKVIDKLREMVRLGAGLNDRKQVTEEAEQRALECLSRFGQQLREFPRSRVRAVGTNTLRQVNDGGAFLRKAEAALGHHIDVIAGREEARLIYLGVAHGLAAGDEQRLVVDIGGGSTELILGRGMQPRQRESLFMGCVSISRQFFGDAKITRDTMDRAITACRLEVRPVHSVFHAQNWAAAVGSSGTIKAIQEVVLANGWSDNGITRSSLKKLRKALIAFGSLDKMQLDGLTEERRPVFVGGVAVLSAVFKSLRVECMSVSDLALREGLLYEMLGIIQHHDTRDRTTAALIKRFSLDDEQGERVATTVTRFWEQAAPGWLPTDPEYARLLDWAAHLHEIGLMISHSAFHKHGAYILSNLDMPGFSRQQQAVLAALVRGHRRKFPSVYFEQLGAEVREPVKRLCILLRLAVLIHRGRSSKGKPLIRLEASDTLVKTQFPRGWLEDHPLTRAEMAAEAIYLEQAGYALAYEFS